LLSHKDRTQFGLLPHLARATANQQCVRVISVLVLEYPPLIRRALVARLLLETDLRVVAEADHASEALRRAYALRPDVVLLDAQMPNLDVPDTVRKLSARSPSSRIVLLSLDSGRLARDLDGDAPLIVGRHEGIEALLTAIRATQTRTSHTE
jgi:two-component system, NarL family, response regulator DesR